MPVRTRSQTAQESSTLSMLDRLPPELLHHILDSIEPLDRIEREDALCRCNLVSKALCAAARPLLWRDLAPLDDDQPEIIATARRDPALASLVRAFTLTRTSVAHEKFAGVFPRLQKITMSGTGAAGGMRTEDWRTLSGLPGLDILVLTETALFDAPPPGLSFPSLSTLVLHEFSSEPKLLDDLLQVAVFPNLRALSIDQTLDKRRSTAYPVASLSPRLLSALEVLQVTLKDVEVVSTSILRSGVPILYTNEYYLTRDYRWELRRLHERAPVQHLCLTRIESASREDAEGIYYRVDYLEDACRTVKRLWRKSDSPVPLSLWLSPQLEDALGPDNEALSTLLALCRTRGIKVGWLERCKDDAEDKAYGAVLDAGLRRYFRSLKAERDSKET